ncbi:DUF3667 domain-containing protein [Rudanella paleaurantiibacter]|uniref:DUF3667 domain-containing protein n=1 Tax=Rudanella paleaurantiibacter TaxID=2614655 RepID=A0A7J5TWB7_9BACT|nr:DUF3667 domain-containing protein [Rudanella paleaurantiibacter]KAB7728740.1 DUF3667 domain-containing protein [Rudanella paleaurantiibacter]
MAHKHHRKLEICPNCQRHLAHIDNFCPNCGQENHDLRLPFGHVVYEVVEGFTHFDGKLWVTLRDMFTRPGQVPLDFIEGRRQRHVPPIRLYIFVSFLSFLLINLSFNKRQERSTLKTERLKAVYGPDRQYREMSLKDIYSLLNTPNANLGSIATIAIQFAPADSTGRQTLRQWRSFTDTQLDSVLYLYHSVNSATQRNRLREAIAGLPSQLMWLPLRELANTIELPVDNDIKKKAGIDTTLSVNLRFSPNDTLGTGLYTRIKALSPAERTQYASVNKAIRSVAKAPLIQIKRELGDSQVGQQFSRLIDTLKPHSANYPLRFYFGKGFGTISNLVYTNEALARADVSRMREMTSDERFTFYVKQVGVPQQEVDNLDFISKFMVKRSLNHYVQFFDKSENDVTTAQFGTAIKYISYSFFLLMPLVAVYLYVFYRRRKKYYYVDHLIFSINMHTVAFVIFSIVLLLFGYTALGHYAPTNAGPLLLILFTAPVVLYFLLALRTVYQQSWGSTVAKLLGLTLLYSATFSLVLGGAFVLGFI